MENECKGCVAYRNTYGEDEPHCGLALISRISETEQCPCITCIVKVVCVSTCSDYQKYVTKSNKFRRDNNI